MPWPRRDATSWLPSVPLRWPPADFAPASSAEGEFKIVNFDLLEEQTRKILPPGRFAFMGSAGDGTYRENRRLRRGIDVFKALALGATAVAVGRPVLWGLAAGGGGGVKSVYGHLAGEMNRRCCFRGWPR